MPCMELFDLQPENYREDILEDNSLIVTLEAGSIMSWQKYIKGKGINLGIDKFGESAPYKEVYKHFRLSEDDITSFIQKKIERVILVDEWNKFFPNDLEVKDQKIILRLDFNVPIEDKVIKDDTRIVLCLPFINSLIEKKAKIIIISHLGRPKGVSVPELSLTPIYKYLKETLKTDVFF